MKLTRRELAPLALSAAAACASPVPPASAQQRRRTRSRITPPLSPVPAPRRDGDIGGLVTEGGGGPTGTVMLVGHAFPRGALPRDYGLALRLAAGDRPIEAGLQVIARHADGSARLVLISLAAPAPHRGGGADGILMARVPPQGRAL